MLGKTKTSAKLSRSGLESLAIIAYKQPIVRAEIESIRGVETSGVLRTLLERKLVRIVGRKDVPGRPIMYGTTKFFLQHFGLRDLGELPPLREFKELGESEQAMLPVGDEPLQIGEDASAVHAGSDSPLLTPISDETSEQLSS
jgi:segregation and condensation protein B